MPDESKFLRASQVFQAHALPDQLHIVLRNRHANKVRVEDGQEKQGKWDVIYLQIPNPDLNSLVLPR